MQFVSGFPNFIAQQDLFQRLRDRMGFQAKDSAKILKTKENCKFKNVSEETVQEK